jgi:hypothetical protein
MHPLASHVVTALQWVSPPRTQLVLIGTDAAELDALKEGLREACLPQGQGHTTGAAAQGEATATQFLPAAGVPAASSSLLPALEQAHPQLRARLLSSSSSHEGREQEQSEELLVELQVSE